MLGTAVSTLLWTVLSEQREYDRAEHRAARVAPRARRRDHGAAQGRACRNRRR
jgi:hypothetical protein